MHLLMLSVVATWAATLASPVSVGGDSADCTALPAFYSQASTARVKNVGQDGEPIFELYGETIEEVYTPGTPYVFDIDHDFGGTIRHFQVNAVPVDTSGGRCSHPGEFVQLIENGPVPRERMTCNSVVEMSPQAPAFDQFTSFMWTSPECGCVTLRATLLSEDGDIYHDNEGIMSGPLTLTLCARDTEEEPTPFDAEYYGIEEDIEDGTLLIADILDEVNDALSPDEDSTEEDFDEDVDATDEDSIDEDDLTDEVEDGPGGRRGHRRGHHHGGRRHHGRRRGNHHHRRWEARREKMTGEDGEVPEFENKKDMRRRWKQYKQERRSEDSQDDSSDESSNRRWKGKVKTWKAKKFERVCERLTSAAPKKQNRRARNTNVNRQRPAPWQQARQELQACCNILLEDDKYECFRNTHAKRMSQKVCSVEENEDQPDDDIPNKIKVAKEKCCEQEGEEQFDCLKSTLRVMKKMRKQKRASMMTEEEKANKVCKKISKKPAVAKKLMKKDLPIVQKRRWTAIFTARRLQVQECCQLDAERRPECLQDVKEQRLDRVCKGEEPLSPPWMKRKCEYKDMVVQNCCVLEDGERYGCFDEKLGCHGCQHRGRHHHRHHGPHSTEEEEDSDENTQVQPEEFVEEDSVSHPRGNRRNERKHMNKARRANKVQKRKCCKSGRKAGSLMGEVDSKWQTCQAEAEGFMVDRPAAAAGTNPNVCKNSFRRCCVSVAIRNAREEAVEEAEMEEDLETMEE